MKIYGKLPTRKSLKNKPPARPSQLAKKNPNYWITGNGIFSPALIHSLEGLKRYFIDQYGKADRDLVAANRKAFPSARDTRELLRAGRFLVKKEDKLLAGDLMHYSGDMRSVIKAVLGRNVKFLEEYVQARTTYLVFELTGKFKTRLLAEAKHS
jgi:hypothetical protein